MQISKIVETRDDNTIVFETEDGAQWAFDATEYIRGPWFGKLADRDYFAQAQPYYGDAIGWPEGQSIGPEDIDERSVRVG